MCCSNPTSKVLEIPSWAWRNGSFATEAREATAPCVSLRCIGFAPGANGSPIFLPSKSLDCSKNPMACAVPTLHQGIDEEKTTKKE